MKKSKSAEEFIAVHPQWQKILVPLRKILLATELEETIKWSVPVYTLGGKNVVGLMAFKHHVAMWFFQGALLKDSESRLVNAQEGVTKAQRQWRFETPDDLDEKLVRSYVDEAIENQRQGKVIKPAPKKKLVIPPELQLEFDRNQSLEKSFSTLTPFKQREYADHIAGAKRQDTKMRRLEKIVPMILEGAGLNDRYKC